MAERHAIQRRLFNWQARAAPYLFLLPFLLLFAIFLLYPLARSVVLSLYRSSGPREASFIGLGNYRFILRDIIFWKAVLNTVVFTAGFLLLQIPLALALALLLNSRIVRGRNVFRFAFVSSHMVGHVFVALMFILLLAPRQGLVNRMIGALLPWVGTELNWRGNASLVLPALLLASLWLSVGYAMIYFLAALQAVDQALYDAAEVDGAGAWSRFWHVTLPSIRPMLVFILLVGTIGAFQLFELPYVLFDPPTGPGGNALTIVMYLYQQGFEAGNIGYASAVGWVLVILLVGIAAAQLKLTGAMRDA
jgi:ABC-type sugar transport system permease subunit